MKIHFRYTLLDIARHLGVEEATVQRYESGKIKQVPYETVVKLSEIYHCSPSYLMGWDPPTDSSETTYLLTEEEKTLIENFRLLGKLNRNYCVKAVHNMLDLEYEAKNSFVKSKK